MKPHSLKLVLLSLFLAFGIGSAVVAGPAEAAHPLQPASVKKTFVFSLLPKAFQKNPLLAITVITEMTDEGKKLKEPTPTNPTYYVMVPSGFHQEGDGKNQEKTLSVEYLEKEVKKSLASASYVEGNKEHAPTLVLFFVWGAHNKLADDDKGTGIGAVEDVGHRNLLSRAALVGGRVFAEELAAAIDEQADSPSGDMLTNPVYRFSIRSDKNRSLMDQVVNDCYYVVVSAYEGAALAHGEKKLLWRTKMSTAAQGVSLAETSTALVASGGPFFGRQMTVPSIIDKRISRNGKVELGETRTISMDEPATTTEPTKTAIERKK